MQILTSLKYAPITGMDSQNLRRGAGSVQIRLGRLYTLHTCRGGALPPAQGGFRKRCRTFSQRKMARRPQCVICGYDERFSLRWKPYGSQDQGRLRLQYIKGGRRVTSRESRIRLNIKTLAPPLHPYSILTFINQ